LKTWLKRRLTDPFFDGDIVRAAVELWQGDIESVRHVSSSANRIYAFVECGTTRYLRLISSLYRTREQVDAELDFIAYLRRGGVKVVSPVVAASGRFIEEISFGNEVLFGCVFEEAAGDEYTYDPANSNEEHFRVLGRALGQIHALSRAYSPTNTFRRFAWDEDKLLLEAAKFLPKSEKRVWHVLHELRERLHDYPKSAQTFGLIHGDLGTTNYRCAGGQLNIFDFDDCSYHWFLYDLAITIYPHGWRKEGLRLLDSLLDGYSGHMKSEVTRKDLTMFCHWRLVYLFLIYARKWGFEKLSRPQADWFARKRENISGGYQWLG